ncbi:hypothetical protein V1509DRAFT_656132 [Lipomyces kononenkoae]
MLGGFYRKGSLTEASMVWILGNVLLVVEHQWSVRHRSSGRTIRLSSDPVLIPPGNIRVSDEAWIARLISHSVSDEKCLISAGFQAAHVFPLEYESLWIQFNYRRWIINMDSANLHTRFDQYLFSINPDDCHKIITFAPNHWGIDGKILGIIAIMYQMTCCGGTFDIASLLTCEAQGSLFLRLRVEPYGKERLEMELGSRLKFIPGEG